MAARLGELVANAERKIEAERREREAQWRRYEIEEDARETQDSVKESRDQLEEVIRQWADTRAKSEFLNGLEQEIDSLPEADRMQMKLRVDMARSLIGASDPMSHFLTWQSPEERYSPKNFTEDESTG
jgi:hypothetical protein